MSESNLQKTQSPYTPTTKAVRLDYMGEIDPIAKGAEFDRWLAEVKAQAWEEGYRDRAIDIVRDGITDNPYRQGADK